MRTFLGALALAIGAAACTKDESDTSDDTDTVVDTNSDTDSDTVVDSDSGWYDTGDTGGGGDFDLTFTGTGYNPHIGRVWWLALYDSTGAYVDYDEGVFEDGTIDALHAEEKGAEVTFTHAT